MPTPDVSVCMAAHNGSRFVEEQLSSILDQLGPHDEVIVVDDASTDTTADVVAAVADPRVRLVRAPQNRGYVRTFEAALREARGRYVFLSDQDDVWRPGRVDAMRAALDESLVVATNLSTLGADDAIVGPFGQPDWRLHAADSSRPLRNVLGILAGNRPYYGCAMAVRSEALDLVLPFPSWLNESHDLWIALAGNLSRSMRHLEVRSLERRLHGGNQTPNRPRGPLTVLRSRLMLLRAIAELLRRRLSRRS